MSKNSSSSESIRFAMTAVLKANKEMPCARSSVISFICFPKIKSDIAGFAYWDSMRLIHVSLQTLQTTLAVMSRPLILHRLLTEPSVSILEKFTAAGGKRPAIHWLQICSPLILAVDGQNAHFLAMPYCIPLLLGVTYFCFYLAASQ